MLPIALGNAVKVMPALARLDKQYVGVMRVHRPVEEAVLREMVVSRFVGMVKQLPPRRAAVARRLRLRRIYFFDVLELEGKDVLFKVGCEAGTYVRKLIHDLGIALGVGAHLIELRRTRFGPFGEEQTHPLFKIEEAYFAWRSGKEERLRQVLIPVDYALPHVKKVFVKDTAIDAICRGAPVYAAGLCRIQEGIKPGELVAVYSLKEELIALGIAMLSSEQMLRQKSGIAVRTDRVLMQPGIYPCRFS